MLCRRQVAGLREALPRIERSGARLFVIGLGSPTFIAGFREETGFPGAILIDRERRAYQAAALRRPRFGWLHPGTIRAGIAALRAGFRQSAPQGDAAQLGGVFVVAPGDRLLLGQVERFAGDTLPPERILALLPPGGG